MATEAAKKTPRPCGRPTTFTPELGAAVCAHIAAGASVAKVAKKSGMPAKSTIFAWLATADAEPAEGDDGKRRPYDEFRQLYLRAREIRADTRFEKVDEIVELMIKKEIDPQAARVMIDAIKWQTGKENQSRYGDAMTLRGDKSAPVQVQQRTVVEMSEAELHAVAAQGLANAAG